MTDTKVDSDQFVIPSCPHTMSGDDVLSQLNTSMPGLSEHEASRRLSIVGRNTFPEYKTPGYTTNW